MMIVAKPTIKQAEQAEQAEQADDEEKALLAPTPTSRTPSGSCSLLTKSLGGCAALLFVAAVAVLVIGVCTDRVYWYDHSRNHSQKVVYYLHFHKAGGSTMCTMAYANNLITTHRQNCNLRPANNLATLTLAGQLEFWENTPYEFVANERSMPAEIDMVHFLYFTTVRHPVARALSQFHHYGLDSHRGTTFAEWMQSSTPHNLDNWYVRRMIGLDEGEVVTANHTAAAIQRLRAFTGVMVTEDYERTSTILALRLGWTDTDTVSARSGTHHDSNPNDVNVTSIAHLFHYDMLFYEAALNKAYDDLRDLTDDH